MNTVLAVFMWLTHSHLSMLRVLVCWLRWLATKLVLQIRIFGWVYAVNTVVILHLTIPKNVFGPGLCIVHHGTVVVSEKAQVGRFCRIHPGTCIGDYNGAPTLGDYVYIGPGAKLFGDIHIGNNVAIGANSVVNSSFGDNQTIGGIPARHLSAKTSLENGVYPDCIHDEN